MSKRNRKAPWFGRCHRKRLYPSVEVSRSIVCIEIRDSETIALPRHTARMLARRIMQGIEATSSSRSARPQMHLGYSPRQRQRIRQQLNKHCRERAQWFETFACLDTGKLLRVPVDAREAAMACMVGYAEVSLE